MVNKKVYKTKLMLTWKQADKFVKKYRFYHEKEDDSPTRLRDKYKNQAAFYLLTSKVGTEVKITKLKAFTTYEFSVPDKKHPLKLLVVHRENPVMATLLDHFVCKIQGHSRKITPYVWFRIQCDKFLVDEKGQIIKWFDLFPNTFDPTSDKLYKKGEITIRRKEGKTFNVAIFNNKVGEVPQHIAEHIFTYPEMYAALCPQNKKEILSIYKTSMSKTAQKIKREPKRKRKRIRIKRKIT
jgi:hypothetical protein